MPPIKLSIFNECGCHNQYPFNFGELKEPEHYTSLSSSMNSQVSRNLMFCLSETNVPANVPANIT